jgi:hypothetical protein
MRLILESMTANTSTGRTRLSLRTQLWVSKENTALTSKWLPADTQTHLSPGCKLTVSVVYGILRQSKCRGSRGPGLEFSSTDDPLTVTREPLLGHSKTVTSTITTRAFQPDTNHMHFFYLSSHVFFDPCFSTKMF